MVENHLPTRLKIIDPQEHSHEERCAIIDAHTLTTIPTTFVFLTTQLSVRFLENIWLLREGEKIKGITLKLGCKIERKRFLKLGLTKKRVNFIALMLSSTGTTLSRILLFNY